MANHTDLVAEVKKDLITRGVDLKGDCGAFEITKRVAWRLRAGGYGLLSKPGGANCQGYAVGIILSPIGEVIDMLGDAGGQNGPRWDETGELRPREQWRAPVDPGDDMPAEQPGQEPPPAPPPAPEGAALGVLRALLDQTTQQTAELQRIRGDLANGAKLLEQLAAGGALGDLLGGLFERRSRDRS